MSSAFSSLKFGDSLLVSGPFGREILLPVSGPPPILVGGGIGAAALLLLAKHSCQHAIVPTVCLGAKKRKGIVGFDHFRRYGARIRMICEESRYGQALASDLLAEELAASEAPCQVVSCGPRPMLRRVAEICDRYGAMNTAVVEELPDCSTKPCNTAIACKDGSMIHICKEGPGFAAQRIDWKRFSPRNNGSKATSEAGGKCDFRAQDCLMPI